ncbi:uncharacterized protein LOC109914130 [Rhincodon typus]|uniref:uncharacterized protein LOC109914130 n=1 Tax=Rhincodon typus TaxID=259920 RepID=UPI00202F34EF|nr:uncharacterized protein LOC109914130 [Rhincodon typus]
MDETRTLLSGIQGLRETLQSEEKGLHHIRQKLQNWAELGHAIMGNIWCNFTPAMRPHSKGKEMGGQIVITEWRCLIWDCTNFNPPDTWQNTALFHTELDQLYAAAMKRRKRLAEDNATLVQQELMRMERELQQQKVLCEFRKVSQLKLDGLEKRYRKLLQEAIQDAVQLSAQKQQLELEKKLLKQRIAELCDQLSATKQQEVTPHPGDGETGSHQDEFPQ